jgi:SOS response regulatory protein OraA/RecX
MGATICLEPISRNQKIVHIVEVYTRRFPAEAPNLMKYGEIVQDLASRGFHWQLSDENFQFLRQTGFVQNLNVLECP